MLDGKVRNIIGRIDKRLDVMRGDVNLDLHSYFLFLGLTLIRF